MTWSLNLWQTRSDSQDRDAERSREVLMHSDGWPNHQQRLETMKTDKRLLEWLKDFQAWASGVQGRPLTLLDYAGFVGTPDLFFAFAELFQPELLEHEGAWFLSSGFTEEGYQAWKERGHSRPEIQKVLNHVHVGTLFQNQHVPDEVAVAASQTLAEIWRGTLGHGLRVESGGTGLQDAYVTFFGEAPGMQSLSDVCRAVRLVDFNVLADLQFSGPHATTRDVEDCALRLSFRTESGDRRLTILCRGVEQLTLRELGGGVTQVLGLAVEDLRDRGLEDVRWRIYDVEDGRIDLLCRDARARVDEGW